MTMPVSNYISIAAILIALASFICSLYFGLRDRSRVKASCRLYNDDRMLTVQAVNHGRRPVVLIIFGGKYDSGQSSGTYLGEKSQGIRLGEHEKYEQELHSSHPMVYRPEHDTWIEDLWFEDTLGRRYRVKDAKRNLKRLLKT
jgi:hypothetical protein